MAFTFLSRRTALNDFVTRSGDAPPPMSRKFAGSPPAKFDHIERRHRKSRTVDDAADVAVEADVGKSAIRRVGFARVFLALVAKLGDVRPPEQRVFVERHLRVERHNLLFLGYDERIDLNHHRVEIAEGAIATHDRGHELVDDLGINAEPKSDFAGLELLHADCRVDTDADDRIGL